LLKESDGEARRHCRASLKLLINAGKSTEKRTLAVTVQTDDADLGAVEIRQVDIFEDSFLVVVLADPNHGVDDFIRLCAHKKKIATDNTDGRAVRVVRGLDSYVKL